MNYVLVGGTLDQQRFVVEVLSNSRIPELKREMKVRITDLGSYWNGSATPWTIKLSERLRPDNTYWRHVVYHEVGHVFDYHYLTDTEREVVMTFMPQRDTMNGWHGTFLKWSRRPKERFADDFSDFIRCRDQDYAPRSLIGRMVAHADRSWSWRNPGLYWGCPP